MVTAWLWKGDEVLKFTGGLFRYPVLYIPTEDRKLDVYLMDHHNDENVWYYYERTDDKFFMDGYPTEEERLGGPVRQAELRVQDGPGD